MGPVFFLHLQPDLISLRRAQVRVFIDDMLKFVHSHAVGDEGEGGEGVHVSILGGVPAEELLHMGPGEKLHAHGVGLRRLHAAAAQLQGEAVAGDEIGVERVARLVGHHVHIPGGAVEVCQNKGLPVLGELRAVAAAPFVFPGVHVKGLVFQHHVDEGAGLRPHGVIHLPGGGKDPVPGAGGRVPAGNDDFIVIELIVADAQPLRIFKAQPGHQGHDVVLHVLPESGHLLLVVAEPAHAVIAQLHEVFIAHFPGHAVPHPDHLVINPVKPGAVGLKGAAQNLHGLPAQGPVAALEMLHQHGPGQLLPAEFKLHARHEPGILADKPVLLHHIRDDALRHGPALHIHGQKQHRRQRRFQRRPEGRVQQGGGVLGVVIAYGGADLVVIIVFSQIKAVGGVDGIAHIGQAAGGVKLQAEL